MAWFIVPALEDLRLQLNAVFPNRDKTSDGGVGDTSHAAGSSSHNPDKTGNPEYADGDSLDEIRARDFDVDLRDPQVNAQDVVDHLVKGAKSGEFWWIRYIIYNRKIYHKNNAFVPKTYTGSNPHDKHFHVNNDFTQKADTVSGVDYHLEDLVAITDAEIKKIADAVWNHVETDPYDAKKTRRMGGDLRLMEYRRDAMEKRQNVILQAIASKVDVSPEEINAIKEALAVPTAESNAQAVLDAIGGVPMGTLAETLRIVLSESQLVELADLLSD